MSDDPDGVFLLKRDATIADYEEARQEHRAQIIDGDLWLFAPASGPHQVSSIELGSLLAPVRDPIDASGWVILPDINLRLGSRDLFSPDFTGWRRSRMPVIPEATYFELAPDWVCEILSPSTRRFDLGKKREVYAKAGVEHLWFIEPKIQTLSVYGLVGSGYQLIGSAQENDQIALSPFLDLTLDLSKLWRR
ncbi:MAG: Uma2 family endonuclease [Kofleriaceae bacterium]